MTPGKDLMAAAVPDFGYYFNVKPARKTSELELGLPYALTEKIMPRLLTFDDISDLTTARQVDPDDLAAAFGPGVRLKSITVERTEEPVTWGGIAFISDQLKAAGKVRGGVQIKIPTTFKPKVGYETYIDRFAFSSEAYK